MPIPYLAAKLNPNRTHIYEVLCNKSVST